MNTKLNPKQLEELARENNWAVCLYDNNGILMRNLDADAETGWEPVTDKQIDTYEGTE